MGEGRRGDSASAPILAEHRVIVGDTLNSLAQDYYGKEELWLLFWDPNKGMADHYGRTFDDRLYAGWILEIPSQQNRQTPDSTEVDGGQS